MAGKWGGADFNELKKFQQKLERFQQNELDEFCRSCAKELAARLLAKTIKRTPVRDTEYTDEAVTDVDGNAVVYKRGKNKGKAKTRRRVKVMGGTLRRGWTAKSEDDAARRGGNASVVEYVNSMTINKVGSEYHITIENPVSYASYVEFGHRTRGHKSWVPGQFMLTSSEIELEREAPGVLERKLAQKLSEVLS